MRHQGPFASNWRWQAIKIAFSTLGCPDWSWERILDNAQNFGYDGISVRGVGPQLDLTLVEPFLAENVESTKADLARRGLALCTLDTSVSFHDPADRERMLAAGRDHLALAARLGAGGIRVFGERVPEGESRAEVEARIAAGLRELGIFAEPLGVDVLLETHGDFSSGRVVRRIMELADRPRVKAIWDIHHPFCRDGETPAETLALLGGYLGAVHLKDAKLAAGDRACLLGEGDIPVRECLDLLKGAGYDGWLIFEWEKRWHPEIEDPAEAFPHYIKVVREYLA